MSEPATPPAYRSDAVSQPPPPTTPPLGGAGQPAPDAPPDGPALADATWGAGRAFGGLAFLVVAVILLGVIVVAFDPEVESLAAQVSLQALLAGALVLTAFLFASPGLRSLAPREALGLRRPLRKAIWLSVIAYFGYVACAIAISLVLSPEQEDITRELGGDEGALGTIIAGILIVGIAPLSEEIFFRGFLFAGLRRAMPVAVGGADRERDLGVVPLHRGRAPGASWPRSPCSGSGSRGSTSAPARSTRRSRCTRSTTRSRSRS